MQPPPPRTQPAQAVDDGDSDASADDGEDDGNDSKTVAVRGLKSSASDDKVDDIVELYFESKRRSDGGPIKCIKQGSGGVIYITFEKAEGET
jgi:hypothetical protein